MGYISVLASFVPPRSGGVFPFSYNHDHHDITSRLILLLLLLLLNVIVTYIYIYIMVVPPQPRPPHFAAYIRHFARKLDSRLHKTMTPQTDLPATTNFPPFHFCRMSQAKRYFFTKVALSPTRESLFSLFSRSPGLAQMYSLDLV